MFDPAKSRESVMQAAEGGSHQDFHKMGTMIGRAGGIVAAPPKQRKQQANQLTNSQELEGLDLATDYQKKPPKPTKNILLTDNTMEEGEDRVDTENENDAQHTVQSIRMSQVVRSRISRSKKDSLERRKEKRET